MSDLATQAGTTPTTRPAISVRDLRKAYADPGSEYAPSYLISVLAALAAFGVIAWFSIRHNIHGIDFDEVPSGPELKSGPDRGEEGSGETGPRQ